jgi:5-methyltetrahydrofolate--homocysteine methyltransferase
MSVKQEIQDIHKAVMSLSVPKTEAATKKALDAGVDRQEILVDGLAAGLLEVGDKWIKQEMFISHVLVAAKAMKAGQAILQEGEPESEGIAVMVLGTAQGDLHDIGKNLVGMMMKAAGFKVYDLGVDVAPQAFVDKAKEVDADIIGISLIMSICLDKVEETCALAKKEGIKAKVLIGGPATSDIVAEKVGAGGYGGFDAPTGVVRAKELVGIS